MVRSSGSPQAVRLLSTWGFVVTILCCILTINLESSISGVYQKFADSQCHNFLRPEKDPRVVKGVSQILNGFETPLEMRTETSLRLKRCKIQLNAELMWFVKWFGCKKTALGCTQAKSYKILNVILKFVILLFYSEQMHWTIL